MRSVGDQVIKDGQSRTFMPQARYRDASVAALHGYGTLAKSAVPKGSALSLLRAHAFLSFAQHGIHSE